MIAGGRGCRDMTDSRGKRLLIAAMVCLLALICVLSWGGDGRGGATASTQALENETLSIEVNGEGTLYIRGEGALTLNDMKLMMDRMQLKTNQVDDIVIGDGITEIGYNVINGYTYLQTLKLGAGMRVVNNGAIKSCTALEYVFVPKGVQRLGKDFMYRCDKTIVVTDGEAKDLPKMKNVPSERVLAQVDSYESLLARRAALVPAEGEAEAPEVPEACREWWQ